MPLLRDAVPHIFSSYNAILNSSSSTHCPQQLDAIMSNERRTTSPRTAFISGPVEPEEEYFLEHYVSSIRTAISDGDSFVMGPSPGMDTMALNYLLKENVHPSRITIYLAEFQALISILRDRKEWFEGLGGNVIVEGLTTSDRDAAMTRDSDYDILRYMSIQEQKEFYGARYYPRVSATEKNERRRLGLPLHINYALEGHSEGLSELVDRDASSSSPNQPLFTKWKQGVRSIRAKIFKGPELEHT